MSPGLRGRVARSRPASRRIGAEAIHYLVVRAESLAALAVDTVDPSTSAGRPRAGARPASNEAPVLRLEWACARRRARGRAARRDAWTLAATTGSTAPLPDAPAPSPSEDRRQKRRGGATRLRDWSPISLAVRVSCPTSRSRHDGGRALAPAIPDATARHRRAGGHRRAPPGLRRGPTSSHAAQKAARTAAQLPVLAGHRNPPTSRDASGRPRRRVKANYDLPAAVSPQARLLGLDACRLRPLAASRRGGAGRGRGDRVVLSSFTDFRRARHAAQEFFDGRSSTRP